MALVPLVPQLYNRPQGEISWAFVLHPFSRESFTISKIAFGEILILSDLLARKGVNLFYSHKQPLSLPQEYVADSNRKHTIDRPSIDMSWSAFIYYVTGDSTLTLVCIVSVMKSFPRKGGSIIFRCLFRQNIYSTSTLHQYLILVSCSNYTQLASQQHS